MPPHSTRARRCCQEMDAVVPIDVFRLLDEMGPACKYLLTCYWQQHASEQWQYKQYKRIATHAIHSADPSFENTLAAWM